MKIIVPKYYADFACIASQCRHSCCIGWEIDIDSKTAKYYKKIKGDFGKRLKKSIKNNSFILDANERCPFLNKENLCDIITTLGEDALCQICADHPRFKNYFENRIEIGLGLCCEEAARIILNYPEKMSLIELENDGNTYADTEEAEFFKLRQIVFDILQDREFSVNERIDNLCDFFDITIPQIDWLSLYLGLERLDEHWGELLIKSKNITDFKPQNELLKEQLIVYFIYRHFADGLIDGRIKERIAFSILSLNMILKIASVENEDIFEIARMYSSEIEYSDENIDIILDNLKMLP